MFDVNYQYARMTFPNSVQVKLVLLIRFHMITYTSTRASVMYCNFIQCHDLWVMYNDCVTMYVIMTFSPN